MSINRTIKALGIAKSSIYYKPVPYPKRTSPKRKSIDEQTQGYIKKITGKKATYGVPRVRAILKRDYGLEITKYMLNRYMKEAGLLIKQNRKRGVTRPHTGVIQVSKPNTRWASDITSIKCWNGEKLRVAVVIDCCDRSIVSWYAGKHIQACDIELMLQDALFKRLGENFVVETNQLEFLHDNGPEYIEKKLIKQLEKWNIINCNTPTYSPQSNGMCEAFNGTFKRDYVYENCLDNPQVVYDQIQGWIDEYNNYAPHSALNMKTPSEYYGFKKAA